MCKCPPGCRSWECPDARQNPLTDGQCRFLCAIDEAYRAMGKPPPTMETALTLWRLAMKVTETIG
jgi:hypothetical protein